MHIQRTDKGATQLQLHISAETPDLEPIRRHVISHFTGQVKIPGFRPGKAPAALVEKNIDPKAFQDEFMEHAINDLYRRALDQQKIRPTAQPKIEVKKFVPYSLLEFEAQVEAIGPVTLPDYKKIKLAKPSVSITAKDITDTLDSLRLRMADRTEVERPAKSVDEVIIDFVGKDQAGKAVSGADGQDYPLILGSKAFIPGFEENLVGLKAGEEKQFAVTFPSDYSVGALQGKKLTFEVKVKKVNELARPKLDDSFASKAGPFKTLAELKADIKKQLTAERQAQADRTYENELIQNIVGRSKMELPPRLIDEQVIRLEEEEKRNLAYQGQTWQEHLDTEGITEEQHRPPTPNPKK